MDGYDDFLFSNDHEGFMVRIKGRTDWVIGKSYSTSYDAIIPLIHKVAAESGCRTFMPSWIDDELPIGVYFHNATPAQLCTALLRATGKWKG